MQGPSPVHMEVQCRAHLLNQVQGTRHSGQPASQGSIIGLKDKVSTLVICIQPTNVGPMQTARDLRDHPAVLQTLSLSGQVGATTEDSTKTPM